MGLDSKNSNGAIGFDKWKNHKRSHGTCCINNRDKIDIIVVGTGLAGRFQQRNFGRRQGYSVKAFCQDSPRSSLYCSSRRLTQQKIIQNNGDSVYRLFMILLKLVTTVQEN